MPGAAALARVASIFWESEEVYDENFEAANAGRKRKKYIGLAKLIFDSSPAGDAELAAWLAKEERGIAISLKVWRVHREPLEDARLLACCQSSWDLLQISIEGGTVQPAPEKPKRALVEMAEAKAAPETPPAKPGFLARLSNAIIGGGEA